MPGSTQTVKLRASMRANRGAIRMNIRTLCEAMRFATERGGATAIEYGLIAGGVSIVIILGTVLIGDAVLGMFNQIVAAFGG